MKQEHYTMPDMRDTHHEVLAFTYIHTHTSNQYTLYTLLKRKVTEEKGSLETLY